MIGYIDTPPTVEPHHGLFMLKLGDQQFVITRHALTALEARCRIAAAKSILQGMEDAEKVVPLRRKRRSKPT